jgi:hypothetical protein
MKKALIYLALACALSIPTLAQTADKFAEYDKNLALLRKDIRAGKKELIALNLPLTPTEATKFWPVYEEYANEVSKIYDARWALLKDYASNLNSMTDPAAASISKRSLDSDAAMTTLRQKYAPIVGKVLTGKKAALFFQLDKRLGLLIDLQLASEIPLVVQ